ncbi:hypothetical protein Tsubulata_023537 [Turnera subulata]|uniref:F-box domain-containing protein n=1 Tax=Turnera subulata TaxID=218843 RepID=A0A9Q0EZN4_9ROSI|nr:hypothetical protein Tsubulata_023537 [Turnera subulata]
MATGNLRLPSAIAEEILLLLPNESIHRFRSVSNSWSSLLMVESPGRSLDLGDRGLFLNGALYWKKWSDRAINAFDLVEEKFYDVPGPDPSPFDEWRGIRMGIVGKYGKYESESRVH